MTDQSRFLNDTVSAERFELEASILGCLYYYPRFVEALEGMINAHSFELGAHSNLFRVIEVLNKTGRPTFAQIRAKLRGVHSQEFADDLLDTIRELRCELMDLPMQAEKLQSFNEEEML